MIAALLLGRKGSMGFPGKNTFPVLGRPLCLYPLLAAHHAKHVDRVYVSTDDEEIMDIAGSNGAEIIVRPPELATKEALGEESSASNSLNNALLSMSNNLGLFVSLISS